MNIQAKLLALTLLLVIGLAACAPSPTPQPLRPVRLGVGFVPNVQFAPLYVAQEKGFYAEEGLEVEIQYGYEHDFVALTAQGEREFAIASGDQVILARAQGLPITYVMKWYDRFPVGVVAPKPEGISTPADLSGKTVGLPGLFGASYIGWKALVYATDLEEDSVELEEVGFNQTAAIDQRLVDAAVVYIANEPVQLRDQGIEVDIIEISDYIDLVANGLVVGEGLANEDPALVRAMVRATMRGLAYTTDNPDEAFDIARRLIPEISEEDAIVQRQVLEASLGLWQDGHSGATEEQAWQESVSFMHQTGLLEKPVELDQLYSNQFLPDR